MTRPNISYFVHILFNLCRNLVKSMKTTLRDDVIRIGQIVHLQYVSLTHLVVLFGSSPLSWKTKKQSTIFHSSVRIEYRYIAALYIWVKIAQLVTWWFGTTNSKWIWLYCDNRSTLHITQNLVLYERTKHIEVDCQFIPNELITDIIVSYKFLPKYN